MKHELVKQPLPPGVAPPGQPRDFVDPRSNTGRQLGAGAGQSPQANRTGPTGGMSTSAYRPPTRRADGPGPGPASGNMAAGVKRPPLNDVSNQPQHHVTAVMTDGADAKRQRVSGQGAGLGAGAGVENANANAAAQGGAAG